MVISVKRTDHRNSKHAVESRRAAWQAKLQAELARMVDILCGCTDIERVTVFGSMGRGQARFHSDLDLIVIQRTDVRFVDRIERLCRLLRPRVPSASGS